MLFSKTLPLNILTCQTCHGTGYLKFRKCSECRGESMGMMTRGKFLYWGSPFTDYYIRVRKYRRYLDKFRIIGAIIFSVGLLLFFLFNLYKSALFNQAVTIDFWLRSGNTNLFVFWLSIICFSYLFYRLIVSNPSPEIVELRDYRDKKSDFQDQVMETWVEAAKIPRRKKKNIAKVFTDEAEQILEQAFFIAEKFNSSEVTSLHVFYSLLSSSKVGGIFVRLGVPVQKFQAYLSRFFIKSDQKLSPIISEDVKQILFQAYAISYDIRQEYVNVTELLVGAVNQSEKIQELLYDLNVDKEKLSNVVEWLRIREKLRRQYLKFHKAAAHKSKYGLDRAMTAVATPYLNSFSEDLTLAAKFGYLTPCVAREQELSEIFRIIEGGRQSVILVGEHGVGKMSLIEGLAQKMIEDDVPDRIKDKRLVQLSVSALLAGTTASGAKERMIRIMNEISRAKNIILFIKDIQDLSGVTENGADGVDLTQIMSEYFGPGRFLTLATTTNSDYNRYVVNKSLGKTFSKVEIKEMSDNQAIQVLESKVGHLEYKHNVFFSYDALSQAVKLAKRYLRDQNLPESAIQLMTETAAFVRSHRGLNQLVASEDVGLIVSEKTGVPTSTVSDNESDKLLRLEDEMHQRVIGQNEAVDLVANALRRARAEVRSTKKPIANFLFLGPTGVGKTELAKTIAEVYFGGEEKMIRIDMSEYQDKSSIYRLIGQPGNQGTGILTEAVRQSPFSLVLLDELEKADPDVLNLFLQVFDDGRLTDSVGRLIDFTSTIIIATSNAGTAFVQEQLGQNLSLEQVRQNLMRTELKQYYKPEFLNRFDGIVLFKPLNREDIKMVASMMLKRVSKDLETRGVELKIEPAGLEALADVGFDPEFGARPMRRAIQDKIENKLAELILSGQLSRRDVIVVGGDLQMDIQQR